MGGVPMKRMGWLLAVGVVLTAMGTADAAVLCTKKTGAVVIRDACKKKERAMNLADFGASGPQGAPGATGPGAPCGPEAPKSARFIARSFFLQASRMTTAPVFFVHRTAASAVPIAVRTTPTASNQPILFIGTPPIRPKASHRRVRRGPEWLSAGGRRHMNCRPGDRHSVCLRRNAIV